jgi:hypothetical protein
MIAGIVFVVLFVFGVFFSNDSPSTKSSDSASVVAQKWVTWLATKSHRTEHLIGGYLLIIAAIAFVWFCLGIRQRIENAGPGEVVIGRFVSLLSVLGAGAITAAAMTAAVIPGAVEFGGEKAPTNGDAAHWIMDLTFPFLFVVFGLVSAALIGAVAVATMRSSVFPRWVAYFGWLAVLGAIAAVIFLPMALPLLWYLGVAIAGLVRPAPGDVAGVAAVDQSAVAA